ncbi:MAG TPA: hypothetical protein DIW50_07260 [Prolixibacteraceae bacterium]|nr:hypothetical protein [Prolixibacteraceae bacterium]
MNLVRLSEVSEKRLVKQSFWFLKNYDVISNANNTFCHHGQSEESQVRSDCRKILRFAQNNKEGLIYQRVLF